MRLPRWPVLLLPALLTAALADGFRPARAGFPVFPEISLNTSLLQVGPPRIRMVPAYSVPDKSPFFPAHPSAQLSPSPLLPVSILARTQYFQPPGVVVHLHSVAALMALPNSRRGAEIRREIGHLQAINAGTLDPGALIPAEGRAAVFPLRGLPYLFKPFEFQWAAGAVKRLTLPSGLKGIRYLVIRAGDRGYIPAEMAEYTFQGLSADGRFYVTLNAPYMPTGVLSETQINHTYTKQQQNSSETATYDAYALSAERKMNADIRAPKVRLLDALVNSLRLD